MRIMVNGRVVNVKKKQCTSEFYNKYALMSARKRGIPLNKQI